MTAEGTEIERWSKSTERQEGKGKQAIKRQIKIHLSF